MPPRRPHALVIGVSLCGLGAVRSLARAGIPVAWLDRDFTHPAAASRFATRLAVRAIDGKPLIEDLLALRDRFAVAPALIATNDETATTLAQAGDALAAAYRCAMPAPDLLATMIDKAAFHALARRLHLAVPRSVVLDGDAATASLATLSYPAVVKPTLKTPAYFDRFPKAFLADSAAAAARIWHTIRRAAPAAIVQEWVDGGDHDILFCLQYRCHAERSATVSFVGRKTLQRPALLGNTATCMPAPAAESAELTAMTDAFFAAAGCHGLCAMEFKRRADGCFLAIEPTVGRLDLQSEVAALNNADLAVAAYSDAVDWQPPARRAGRPRAWRDPIAQHNAIAGGAVDALPALAPGLPVADAYMRWSDPGPFLALQRAALRRRLTRLRRTMALPAADRILPTPPARSAGGD